MKTKVLPLVIAATQRIVQAPVGQGTLLARLSDNPSTSAWINAAKLAKLPGTPWDALKIVAQALGREIPITETSADNHEIEMELKPPNDGHSTRYLAPKGFQAVAPNQQAIIAAIKKNGVVITQGSQPPLIAPNSRLPNLGKQLGTNLHQKEVTSINTVLLIAYNDTDSKELPNAVILDPDNQLPDYDAFNLPSDQLDTVSVHHLLNTGLLERMLRTAPLPDIIDAAVPFAGEGPRFMTPENTEK